MSVLRLPFVVLAASLLIGCTTTREQPAATLPTTQSLSRTTATLESLPPPRAPVKVAVYDFPDLTGAHRPNERYADYSKAVTQGGAAILVDALRRAGRGQWFKVVERAGLNNLLKERELIDTTYQVLGQNPRELVDPLTFAEYLIEGGIVSYDTSLASGGIGASYLGLTSDLTYRKDRVVVVLRLIRVRTGEVVFSTTSSRTIMSSELSVGLRRFVTIDDLITAGGGITRADATHVAIQEAVELAVVQFVLDGAAAGHWARVEPAGLAKQDRSAAVPERSVAALPAAPEEPEPAPPHPALAENPNWSLWGELSRRSAPK